MKTYFWLLLSALLVLACQNNTRQPSKPDNLITDSAFARLLVDYALAEGAANSNVKSVPNSKSDSVYAFNPLKENMIRKSQYDSTLDYYSLHLDEYKKVYEDVLEILSAMEAQKQKVRADSSSK